MKRIKLILARISVIGLLAAFSQCASSQKMDKEAPLVLKSPYFQKWISGIEGGGNGFMLYIPVEESSVVKLEEAYFKGKKITLERKAREAVYVGKYIDPKSLKKANDLVMDEESQKEFVNKLPEAIEEKIPFELQQGECVIAYSKDGIKGYFKLANLPEKEMQAYPMQRRQ